MGRIFRHRPPVVALTIHILTLVLFPYPPVRFLEGSVFKTEFCQIVFGFGLSLLFQNQIVFELYLRLLVIGFTAVSIWICFLTIHILTLVLFPYPPVRFLEGSWLSMLK